MPESPAWLPGQIRSEIAPLARVGQISLKLSFSVVADLRRIGVRFRPEIPQHDQGFGFAGVFKGDSALRSAFGAEELVLSQFREANQLGAVQWLVIDPAKPLHTNQPVSAFIFDRAFDARVH